MCFRPSVAEPIMNCPFCGKQIRSVMGTMPHECPWCEEDIAEAVIAFQEEQAAGAPGQPAAPGAPGAPAAPSAPAAPAAPKAPAAPAAPKPPAAPAAPKAPAARPNSGQ